MAAHHPNDAQDHDHDHDHEHPHAHARDGDACCATPVLAAPIANCTTACCGVSVAQPLVQLGYPKVLTAGIQTPIRIMQMDCPTEDALLRKKLGGMAGVAGMEFNLMQRVLTVTHDPKVIEPILEAVRSLGFTPEIAGIVATTTGSTSGPVTPWWPLALAGVAAIGPEAAHWLGLPTSVAAMLAVAAVLGCGITTYRKV